MLEREPGGPLMTWRCPSWPVERRTRIERIGDHRRAYLEFEGRLSGDRGAVSRVGSGTYELAADPEFNRPGQVNWQIYFKPAAEHADLLLRAWTDSAGRPQWDAAPMCAAVRRRPISLVEMRTIPPATAARSNRGTRTGCTARTR